MIDEDCHTLKQTDCTVSTTYSKQSLFLEQALSFNFELDADGLVAKGLEVGFITKIGDDLYERNDQYNSLFDTGEE